MSNYINVPRIFVVTYLKKKNAILCGIIYFLYVILIFYAYQVINIISNFKIIC